MSLAARREYLVRIYGRYQRAGREHKSRILDEFCAICSYDRKYALRLLHRPLNRAKGKPGPPNRYGPAVVEALKRIWLAADQLCSKRLKAALPLWLEHCGEYDAALKAQLLQLSPATMDRLLKPFRAQCLGRRWPTKPGSLIRQEIPIRTDNSDITQPGFLEADTVAHCGGSMEGDFIWSVTFTDIFSGWTEVRAVWNRSAHAVQAQLALVEAGLSFRIQGFDSDNGGEFINHGLRAYLKERAIRFTRARAYHKNDNAHVEQKNWTHVRQLFGYTRLEHPELMEVMNDLYAKEWSWFQNYFCPSMKLKTKKRVGARYRKVYEPAQTPLDRLLQRPDREVTPEAKKRMVAHKASLNPFALKQSIERKLRLVEQIRRKLRMAA